MENKVMKPFGGFFKQLLVIVLIVLSIYLAEGARGFILFLNLEAFLLVFGGTFLLTWAVYSLKDIFNPSSSKVVLYAAGCAIGMGVLTTLISLMLMLIDVVGVSNLPLRTAFSFSGLVFGLVLSKIILVPIAARLDD